MGFIIETSNLTKTYGSKNAVKDINIHVREGEIYGLIGRNGAGKTTIMRMLSGLSEPTSGDYSICGKTGKDRGAMMKNIGVLIENPGLYPNLSAGENLKIKCIGMGIPHKDTVKRLLNFVGLENVDPKKKAGSFSLGMRQRLGIALALVGNPKMIILDEPINGLDPQGIVEVRRTLEKLRDENRITVMISSHILDELGKIADSYGIIHMGRLMDEFTTDELNERCAQYVLMKTGDNDTALNALNKIGITSYEIDNDNNIRINEQLHNSASMAKAVVESGTDLIELYIRNVSLEDYYLSVTGGQHNG